MSSVYSTEPPTTGKVILVTNYGNIDIELWTKEAPRACRNFLQLCMEGMYNNCVFFRIIKDFMIQTGDPTNTGKGGDSIWGKDFSDEFHSRLRFNHRGIVAMANKNTPNSNSSQFFIAMDKCEWLNKKHTIFGKVVGDTFFNAQSISEIATKDDYPQIDVLPIIIRVDVLINPFLDIIPRSNLKEKQNILKDSKIEKSLTTFKNKEKLKDTNLLSFGDDEDENNSSINFAIKPIHEVLKQDKKLFNIPVIDKNEIKSNKLNNLREKVKFFTKIEPEHLDSESSSSESEELNPKIENDLKIDLDRKSEILQLKDEIKKIKKRIDNPYDEDEENNESKTMTALQKHQAKFLGFKGKRVDTKKTLDTINKFKDILKINKVDSHNWMSNKLKFHVDSQKAYAINESKEKQIKQFKFNPGN